MISLFGSAQSDREWEKFGAREPYFGVYSNTRFLRRRLNDDTLVEFFASGETFVANAMAEARRYFDFDPHGKIALDFGCGVGRLSLPLARRFSQVLASDISPSMLAELQANCERRAVSNVLTLKDDGTLAALQNHRFDFLLSAEVLQHIPRKRGLKILSRLIDRLQPGGLAVVEFPYAVSIGTARHALQVARRYIPGLHWVANVARGRPLDWPFAETLAYPLNEIMMLLGRHGVTQVHCIIARGRRVDQLRLLFQRNASGPA